MKDTPRLAWLNGKTFKQATGGRKNRSGQLQEHTTALIDDAAWAVRASQSFAAAVDKALAELAEERAHVTKIEFIDGQPTAVLDIETSARIDELAKGLQEEYGKET